jgi:hypothetical protein
MKSGRQRRQAADKKGGDEQTGVPEAGCGADKEAVASQKIVVGAAVGQGDRLAPVDVVGDEIGEQGGLL